MQNRFSKINIETNQLNGLNDLIKDFLNKSSIVCEIGSFNGVSTELFANKCKKVFSIDVNCTKRLKEIIDKYDIDYFRKESIEASTIFEDNFFDCVYLDSNHTYEHVCEEIRVWWPKVKHKGILAGHDYLSDKMIEYISKLKIDLSYNWTTDPIKNKIKKGQGVKHAVNVFFKNRKIYLYKDSSWAKIKYCKLIL
jgi:predicted O-methyltransferase YrrM